MIPVLKIVALVGGIGFVGAVISIIAAVNTKSLVKAKWSFRAVFMFVLAIAISVVAAFLYCAMGVCLTP